MAQGEIKVNGKFGRVEVSYAGCMSRVYPKEIMAREIARLEEERRAQNGTWHFPPRDPSKQNQPFARQVRRVLVKRKELLGDLLAGDERAIAAENEIVRAVLKLRHRLNSDHSDNHKIRARIADVVIAVRAFVEKADVVDALAVLA